MEWFGTLVLLFIVSVLLYYYGTVNYNFFDKLGIPHLKAEYPIIGNALESVFALKPMVEVHEKWYKQFLGEKFFGVYNMRQPLLIMKDPDLLENMLIKDFSHFYNRNVKIPAHVIPLSQHLVFLVDSQWKNLRNKLTPTFTSGKLKGMFSQLNDCSELLLNYLKTHELGHPFEAREVMGQFSTDAIGSCAFGLNVNSFSDENSAFKKMGTELIGGSALFKIKLILRMQFGWVLKLFDSSRSPGGMISFFSDLIDNTLKYRKENNIYRPDFLQLLDEIRAKDLELIQSGELSPNDPYIFDHEMLVSNAFVFFLAGFETTSSTLGYAMYQLALNPSVQETLRDEVLAVLKHHNYTMTYDALTEMTYMDQVISETLRLHPPIPSFKRRVTKEYKVPDSSIVFPEGLMIEVPVYSIHRDPQNFPDPEEFRPERFSPENKDAIKKGSYLAFGDGPRICIGKRFALLQIKCALTTVLKNFKVVKTSKTTVPLKYDRKGFFLVPKGGIWVAIEPLSTEL